MSNQAALITLTENLAEYESIMSPTLENRQELVRQLYILNQFLTDLMADIDNINEDQQDGCGEETKKNIEDIVQRVLEMEKSEKSSVRNRSLNETLLQRVQDPLQTWRATQRLLPPASFLEVPLTISVTETSSPQYL